MSYNFVLDHITEDIFFSFSEFPDNGVQYLKWCFPSFHAWLTENEIDYKVHFEYRAPFSTGGEIRARLEVESEQDAVLIRLKWS
jgi:acyl-ACP thioesterase